MENVWVLAALWVGLALLATLLAIWFRISTALTEIVVGTVAQLIIGAFLVQSGLGAKTSWIGFLAGTGAMVLTFLAGAELDPVIFQTKWKEAVGVGLVGFFGPFIGCTLIAYYVLHWSWRASELAGVALSTTSVAVVYAVMLELGFNKTDFGKAILASCFVNDLGTVIALGLIFSPFTYRTLVFVLVCVGVWMCCNIRVTGWRRERIGKWEPDSRSSSGDRPNPASSFLPSGGIFAILFRYAMLKSCWRSASPCRSHNGLALGAVLRP